MTDSEQREAARKFASKWRDGGGQLLTTLKGRSLQLAPEVQTWYP